MLDILQSDKNFVTGELSCQMKSCLLTHFRKSQPNHAIFKFSPRSLLHDTIECHFECLFNQIFQTNPNYVPCIIPFVE